MKKNYLLRCIFTVILSMITLMTATSQLRVFTIGDSTVQDYNDGYAPRKGWGQMLPFFFDKSKAVCYNKAVGGTSSLSFYRDHWPAVRNQLKKGDYVFIQFGINDRNTDPKRYSPKGVFEENIKKFVNDTKAKGAIPVLVSTVRRAAWTNGKPYDSYHEHPQLMRDVAKSTGVPLVDLDKFCYDLFVAQGQLYSERFCTMHLVAGEYPNYKNGNTDQVHYQELGATENARFVVETIEKSTNADLKKLAACTLPRHKVTIKINDASKSQAISRTAEFPSGINVTLKTIPAKNAKFLRWEDGDKKSISTKSLYVVKMGNADVTYKAVYESNIKEPEDEPQTQVTEPTLTIDNNKKALIASDAKSYKWYFNNQVISGETQSTLAVTNNGTYSVEMVLTDGKTARLDICVSIGKDGTIRKIYLIGDSTVCDYKDSQFPMTGWGQVLKYFFNSDIQIINHAIGGRSSRSFREQGRWKTVLNALKPGDFVFIQFGHNDRDTKPERYTPVDKYKLYIDSFVVEARGKGAIPVLVSPMVMNAWNGTQMRNVFAESGNDYRGAMETVAKNRKCAFVDLNMKSYNMFKQFSSIYNQRFFYNTYPKGEYANYPNGSTDNTHFQEMGALTLCRFIIEELTANKDPYISALQRYMKPMYQVTVKANIDKPGSITTSAKFPVGAPVTAKVLPASGTTFQSWNQDGLQKSKTTIYRFTMPAKATTLTAMFEGGSEVTTPTTILPTSFPEGKKRIAYITDPNGATYSSDPIQPMLKKCDDLFVWEIASSNSTVDLSAFDLIVISEETASTAPIMAMLEGLAKPMLSMKVHGYKNADGAWGWATTGFGDNTTETNVVVDNHFLNHPMFKDVTFTNGNEIKMVSEVNTKALTYMNPESFTDATGNISSIANIKGEEQVSILEIEAGSSIAGTKINERYIQIGLNSSSYGNITEDGLSVIKNACYYLMETEENTNIISTQNEYSAIYIYTNQEIGHITIQLESYHSSKEKLQITNLLGECIYVEQLLINSGFNIFTLNKENFKEGIYIVQFGNYHTKIMVK
ncbi:MAG: hypothetical protein IJ916_05160 [Paludibacteraceae bacterium]|nr:hypothetical protein [Paludibacteraceae bacterium]